MITITQVMREVANAIHASADVRRYCERYGKDMTITLGIDPEGKPLMVEDNLPLLSIWPGSEPYNLGYSGEDRVIPIRLRWATFDKDAPAELEVDAAIVEYADVINCDNIGAAIVDAIVGISGLGDELKTANYVIDSSLWPMCVGTCDLQFSCTRSIAREPAIT